MSVEVKIEMGHRAVMRDKATEEGFTHDWTVFVRGAEGNSIDCFVEKVVFHLHESFPKPKRVIKEPPYSVSESGYAGFIMPIDVYFRTKEEPKKVTFKYDLYLRLQASPVCNIRIEKLTFQNPSDDFRNKLLKAGGLTGALSGTAAGTSLSTQACAPPHPPPIDDQLISPPKPVVVEKKPKPHVASKEIKTNQPTPPKPSQPFTDIFGAPIRTKNSPDPSAVKPKESGHSSQTKTKNTPNSSSSSSGKEGKLSSKESHKSKDSHHSNKEVTHPNKEAHYSAKDSLQSKDTHHLSKEAPPEKDPHHTLKDSHSSKESHHSSKENLHKVKEHHKKEGHKKDYQSVKEGKTPKESGLSKDHDSKDSKSSKSTKSDKDVNKSGTKRLTPSDPHSSHGNVEKKKKISPIPSENSDKSSSSTSKHKIKDSKEKTEKQKIKSLGNSVKKEKEKPKHKSSPATSELAETKEMPKPKPLSPKLPATVLKPPSPAPKPPLSPDSCSLDSGSDESHKSFIKAHYSSPGSPASSISDSSLHGDKPLDFMGMSYPSVISPLSNEEPVDEDFSPPPKRKPLSPASIDESSQESKNTENRSMPKLNKNYSHHKSSKSKSENFHRGNGSINSDISMHHSPSPENHNNTVNNSAYREELLELQRVIMASNDGKLLQGIVEVIEKTGKYEITNTTFDFDLCALDYAIIQEIKRCLTKKL